MEGRPLTKENTEEPNPCRTPSRASTKRGWTVRVSSKEGWKTAVFTVLLHHVTIDLRAIMSGMRTEWISPRLNDPIRTQMHYARKGMVTEEMEFVARPEAPAAGADPLRKSRAAA